MGADQCRASLQIPKGKDWGRGGSPLVSFEQASHFQEDPRYKVDLVVAEANTFFVCNSSVAVPYDEIGIFSHQLFRSERVIN